MNIIGHFKTITRHRHQVIKNCFKAGIGLQGLFHDLSKYSYTEFSVGAKYYQGTKSPNDKERQLHGYSVAWLHHKGRNKHHFEYWYDFSPKTHEIEPVEMPLRYLKEMFCDRVAASKIYQGDKYTEKHPLEYFVNSKARKYMYEKNADMMEEWLGILAEHGEKYAFRYIRELK